MSKARAKGHEILKSKTKYHFPEFNPLDDISLTKNLNFYSIDVEDSKAKKQWAIDYWDSLKLGTKTISKLNDTYFNTVGSVAHMIHVRELNLPQSSHEYLMNKYRELSGIKQIEEKVVAPKVIVDKQVAIVDNIITDLELAVDNYLTKSIDFDVKKYLARSEIKPISLKIVSTHFTKMFDEIKAASVSKDDQIIESYSYLSKPQMKKFTAFLQSILDSCNTVSAQKKSIRIPKPKKEKPPSELVKAIQYCESDEVLKLKSVHPQKLIKASEVWLYNTKTRRLIKYTAMKEMKLSVKGASILNFDPEKSGSKIIRKPEVALDNIQNLPIKPINALYTGIKSTEAKVNGRMSSDIIILKVF
jgi:hypothetical protein